MLQLNKEKGRPEFVYNVENYIYETSQKAQYFWLILYL